MQVDGIDDAVVAIDDALQAGGDGTVVSGKGYGRLASAGKVQRNPRQDVGDAVRAAGHPGRRVGRVGIAIDAELGVLGILCGGEVRGVKAIDGRVDVVDGNRVVRSGFIPSQDKMIRAIVLDDIS